MWCKTPHLFNPTFTMPVNLICSSERAKKLLDPDLPEVSTNKPLFARGLPTTDKYVGRVAVFNPTSNDEV